MKHISWLSVCTALAVAAAASANATPLPRDGAAKSIQSVEELRRTLLESSGLPTTAVQPDGQTRIAQWNNWNNWGNWGNWGNY